MRLALGLLLALGCRQVDVLPTIPENQKGWLIFGACEANECRFYAADKPVARLTTDIPTTDIPVLTYYLANYRDGTAAEALGLSAKPPIEQTIISGEDNRCPIPPPASWYQAEPGQNTWTEAQPDPNILRIAPLSKPAWEPPTCQDCTLVSQTGLTCENCPFPPDFSPEDPLDSLDSLWSGNTRPSCEPIIQPGNFEQTLTSSGTICLARGRYRLPDRIQLNQVTLIGTGDTYLEVGANISVQGEVALRFLTVKSGAETRWTGDNAASLRLEAVQLIGPAHTLDVTLEVPEPENGLEGNLLANVCTLTLGAAGRRHNLFSLELVGNANLDWIDPQKRDSPCELEPRTPPGCPTGAQLVIRHGADIGRARVESRNPANWQPLVSVQNAQVTFDSLNLISCAQSAPNPLMEHAGSGQLIVKSANLRSVGLTDGTSNGTFLEPEKYFTADGRPIAVGQFWINNNKAPIPAKSYGEVLLKKPPQSCRIDYCGVQPDQPLKVFDCLAAAQ